MNFFKTTALFFLCASVLLILPQCVCKEFTSIQDEIKTSDMPSEANQLEEITKAHPEASVRAKAHLKLAVWHSSYKNPNPNYQVALKELESYLKLNPSAANAEEVRQFFSILMEIDRITEENKKMKLKIDLLMKENREIKDKLEKLKSLDVDIEEKRKKHIKEK